MHWRLKGALRHTCLALPHGVRLYRWLTSEVLGSHAGMAAKWFRVFPAHIRVLQETYGAEARAQRLWCFDSGTTVAAGLAIALATDVPGLLTDREDTPSRRYLPCCRAVLTDAGPGLAQLSLAPAERLTALLALPWHTEPFDILHAAGMTFGPGHALAEDDEWRGTIGCVFSAGTLEHYAPPALEAEVARMARALHPGGVMSHVVDHRDHRWHADKRLCPLEHLCCDEDLYLRRAGNPLDYHNRWLRSRYVDLFTRHGFTVTCRDVVSYTPDLPQLDRDRLDAPFTVAPEEDFRALVSHFIAIRRA